MKSKEEVEESYDALIKQFCVWAEKRLDIRAALIVGSRARVDHAADEWADLDIIIITTDPTYYVLESDWITHFGKPMLTFIEPTSTGDEKERRVLFEGMLDVDFAIIPQEKVLRLLQADTKAQAIVQTSNLLSRGVRVLVDKDGILSSFQELNASVESQSPCRPTQQEFLEVVSDFIYHAVFTAKHLMRGELWWTVTCLDCYMQRLLLRMIEWHALAVHEWKHDVRFRGRFLEEWADSRAVERLHETFARYDKEDIKRALFAAMGLFRWLATEIAEKLSYSYPADADKQVTEWIQTCISSTGK